MYPVSIESTSCIIHTAVLCTVYRIPVDHRSTDCGVSAYWPMDLGQSIHNSYFHAMRAQITCVFSVIIHQNIDPKSTENPATCRTARMHDFGISICCGQNRRHALTPRSGGLGFSEYRSTSTCTTRSSIRNAKRGNLLSSRGRTAGSAKLRDLKSKYCFCAHVHEIMKYSCQHCDIFGSKFRSLSPLTETLRVPACLLRAQAAIACRNPALP